MYRTCPVWSSAFHAIPYDVFRNRRLHRQVLRHHAHRPETSAFWHRQPLRYSICEKADEFSEELIRDVRDGTLSDKFDVEPRIRQILRLKPNPAGAQRLEELRRRRDGRLIPADYWPRLSLIGCWKGGTVGHYLEKFPEWFDPDGKRPVPVRDWGYLSSEARCTIPLSDEGSQGVLTISSNFFEFVPVEDLEANPDTPKSWNILTVGDLEKEKDYYIFITTTGGLTATTSTTSSGSRGTSTRPPGRLSAQGQGMTA
jgi:hypothetical protein